MNRNEKRELLEVAMQAVGQVLNDQQNRMFSNGALTPDRFPSDAFPNWVQWKLHFVAVAAANRCTQIQAINALPVFMCGNALDEFYTAPVELKENVDGEPEPTLQALFEHSDRALGVLRNDRVGRSEFEALAQKSAESLRDFARRVGWCMRTKMPNNEMNSFESVSLKVCPTPTYSKFYSEKTTGPSEKQWRERLIWRLLLSPYAVDRT